MKTKKIMLLFLIFMIGCGKNNDKSRSNPIKEEAQRQFTFKEYAEKIYYVGLPLRSNCEAALDGTHYGFSDEIISKFGRENCTILGKITDNEKYTAIIYLQPCDTQLPIIVTTDKNGKKIDELELFEGYCGEEEDFNEYSTFNIDKNLKIAMKDSSNTFERDKNGEIIESTKQTSVTRKYFYIDENGRIVEEK